MPQPDPTVEQMDAEKIAAASTSSQQTGLDGVGPEVPSVAERPVNLALRAALQSVSAGNWQDWSQVVSVIAPRAFRYARFLTDHNADAEDILQQALARLAAQPSLLQLVDSPWAYFLKMVRNEAMRFHKKHQRQVPLASATLAEISAPTLVDDPLESAERNRLIQVALTNLPAEQAEVIILKFWEGMTFREIANVTSESQNTTASRYRYAITKLASLLRNFAEEPAHV